MILLSKAPVGKELSIQLLTGESKKVKRLLSLGFTKTLNVTWKRTIGET